MHKRVGRIIFIVTLAFLALIAFAVIYSINKTSKNNDLSDNNSELINADYCSSNEFSAQIKSTGVLNSENPEQLNQLAEEIKSYSDYQNNADCMYVIVWNSFAVDDINQLETNYETLLKAYSVQKYSDNLVSVYKTPEELMEIITIVKEGNSRNTLEDAIIDNSFGGGTVVQE